MLTGLANKSHFKLQAATLLFGVLFNFNQQIALAATATANVEVNIVSTLNITAQSGIIFGDISASSVPGTVTVDTNGSRTTTGGVTVNTNISGAPARYEISGEPNALYVITLPPSVVITSSSGNSMIVSGFRSNPVTNGQLDLSGQQNLYVVATLNVGSFQPFGAYRGVMATTVEYN